jgi:hypothetical protein
MRYAAAVIALLMATHQSLAEQAVTAGQLMANGFEVRASFMVDKGTPVLVLQKGAEAFFCSPLQNDALLKFEFAPIGKTAVAAPPLPTVCAQLK